MCFRVSPSIIVVRNIPAPEYVGDPFVVLISELSNWNSAFESFYFKGSSVLIGSRNIYHFIPNESVESCKNVS